VTVESVSPRCIRFGPFTLDLRTGELRSGESRLKVPIQSIEILKALLERPGELVTREELRARLWPSDTFVDFEHGLNAAVSRLREALGDSADAPRFVETLPRRGYRLICPAAPAPADHQDPTGVASTRRRSSRKATLAVCAGALAVVSGLAVAYRWFSTTRGATRAEPKLERLTANPSDSAVMSARLSPDGRYLAFADSGGVQMRFIETGETHRLADTRGMDVSGWKPDSSGVLASECDKQSCRTWAISLIGQERHRTGASWSGTERIKVAPDGVRFLRLARTPEASLTLIVDPMTGEPVRHLATGDIVAANWTADGRRILCVRLGDSRIESISGDGGTLREVFRAPAGHRIVDAVELADRRILIAMTATAVSPGPSLETELWLAETDATGVVRNAPRRLTVGIGTAQGLSASANGSRVAFLKTAYQSDVYVADGDLRSGSIGEPRRFTLSDWNDLAYHWMPDNRTVLFSSTRNGTADIFKQALDSASPDPFVTGPGDQTYPSVTSDHRWVLYTDGATAGRSIMRVRLDGGVPETVVRHTGTLRPQCAPHGRCVLLESAAGTFVISALDPVAGKGAELARVPMTEGYRILPDGNAFAYVLPAVDNVRNRVRIVSFTGKPSTDVVVENAMKLEGLDWLADGAAFLTSDRGRLLLVSRTGASRALWAPAGLMLAWAVPSPDHQHLAINVRSFQSNAWMMTGF